MIIKEIHIDGFGLYNNFSLTGLNRGINIISGDNEAGKSTLLRFISYTLTGYPRLREQRMAPLSGGAHGGMLILELSNGNELTIKRTGSGEVSIFYLGNRYDNDTYFKQLTGNPHSAFINNIYLFTIDELAGLRNLSESGIEDRIFSIGAGLGKVSVAAVGSELSSEINNLYKPSGKNQRITSLLKEIETKKREYEEKKKIRHRYDQLKKELHELEIDTTDVESFQKEVLSDRNKLSNYLKCFESYQEVVTIDSDLRDLPAFIYLPDNGPLKVELLNKTISEYNNRISELENGNSHINGISALKAYLSTNVVDEKLINESGRIEYIKSNLNTFQRVLFDFNEDQLKLISLSQKADREISGFGLDVNDGDLTILKRILSRRSTINEFLSSLNNLKYKIEEAETSFKTVQSNRPGINISNFAILLSILLIIASVPSFLYELKILGASFAVGSLVIFLFRKSLAGRNQITEIGEWMDELKEKYSKLIKQYESFLKTVIQVNNFIPVEQLAEIAIKIDSIETLLEQKRDIEIKQKDQREPFLKEYEENVFKVASMLSMKESNIEVLANKLIQEFDKANTLNERIREAQIFLKSKEIEREGIIEKIQLAEAEVEEWLKKTDSADIDSFNRKYLLNDKANELKNRRKEAVRTITGILGANRFDEIEEYFQKNSLDDLKLKIEELEILSNDYTVTINENLTVIGGINRELSVLESQSDVSETATDLETQMYNLKLAIKEWLSGRLAIHILNREKTRYEKEKQPAVISNAGNYFSGITFGKYSGLGVTLDSKDIRVIDKVGKIKTIDQLSRGAKEQLLIALRMGFIEEYEKESEPFPLIADEIFVNFDNLRAGKFAEILGQFSIERQVILFTCHSSTPELFSDEKINFIKL